MKTFAIAVSFESDTQPVETIRLEIEADGYEEAIRRGIRRAVLGKIGKWAPRSVVAVVEASAEKRANVSKGLRESVSAEAVSKELA